MTHLTDRPVDITVQDAGSVWLFRFLTTAARKFCEDDIAWENWQRVGQYSYAADHRPAKDLLELLRSEGFYVEID